VSVILLDTSSPENDLWHQTLTDYLYGGDSRYRLCQEVVLGMGGLKMRRGSHAQLRDGGADRGSGTPAVLASGQLPFAGSPAAACLRSGLQALRQPNAGLV